MMKNWIFYQQQQQHQTVLEENMSNLTSAASTETSVLSETQPVVKKKRNLPGHPDPEAEVIALSPKSLLATNRFVCDICNKGFQRDQNLQLHRRGHNLPWKLKQRINKDVVRKKVYVCPVPSCVHHDPSRALGDLTGVKKHFFRKHGEKKWKCDKCSKKYAVQSDWKAHSKTCGTREYRCDCGTLFTRRDSFITHRAFCDALAVESARAVVFNGPNPVPQSASSSINNVHQHAFSMKMEQQIPPSSSQWPRCIQPSALGPGPPKPPAESRLDFLIGNHQENLNSNPKMGPSLPLCHQIVASFSSSSSSHMSATALLQKAAQMGATMSSKTAGSAGSTLIRPHHHHPQQQEQQQASHVSAESGNNNETAGFGLSLSSSDHEQQTSGFVHGLTNDKTATALSSFDYAFGGIFNAKSGCTSDKGSSERLSARGFLGLRPPSHSDIFSITGFSNCMDSTATSPQQQQQQQQHHHHHHKYQSQSPWQG